MKRAVKPTLIALGAILSLALWSSTALAQCAMCKATVAASGNSAAADTFNLAILVLLIPPVAIFCAIFIVAFRYRNVQGRAVSEMSGGKAPLPDRRDWVS